MLHLVKNGTVVMKVLEGDAVDYEGIHISPATVNAMPAVHEGNTYTLVQAPPEPEPEPLTPEKLRAQMPPLSRRQFWLGANSLGLSKADVLAATDDPIIIIEIEEATEFHRDYESIVMLAPLMGITPEQLDDVWMWWASA